MFFRRGKVIFPEFFPGVKWFFQVENYHFGRPKINFSPSSFCHFSSRHFQFPTFLFWFSFFSSPFFHFFPSLSLSIRSAEIAWGEVSGGTQPPAVTPLLPLHIWSVRLEEWFFFGVNLISCSNEGHKEMENWIIMV